MWARFVEFRQLLYLAVAIRLYRLYDLLRTIWLYYGNAPFRRVDLAILNAYLFDNPYTASRRFLQQQGAEDVYAYGETPLVTLEKIAKRCHIGPKDTVIELGSGRGRGCFWLRCFVKCRVIGIEFVPLFVWKAQRIAANARLDNVHFRCEDFLKSDLSAGTVFYLYASNLEDPVIEKLIRRLSNLPRGTRVITVSFPLTDYIGGEAFDVVDSFEGVFLWGTTTIYLHVRN